MDMTPEINKDEIALYDAAVNYCNEHYYQDNLIYKICFDSFIAGAKWALEYGELKQSPRWVSVKDRLPDEGQIVDIWEMPTKQTYDRAVSLKGTAYGDLYYGETYYSGWRSTNYKYSLERDKEGEINVFTKCNPRFLNVSDGYEHREICVENGEVTHWMPLPAAPDESESPGSQEAVEWVEMVRMWHEKFGVNIGTQPGLIGVKRFDMRQNILQEEVDELKSAYEAGELHTVADAICDIIYVVLGTAVEFGLHKKLPALFAEVHRSNMSKLDENGNPVKREDGKILKSKLFSPPNLKEILSL